LGGGPIGSELAQAFQRLGTPFISSTHTGALGREPKEASDILIKQFQQEGMTLHLNAKSERLNTALLVLG